MKQKIEHIWSVLCLSSVTDKETNMMSLQNLIDQLNIESIPQVASKDKRLTSGSPVSFSGINMELVSFLERLDDWKKAELVVDMGLELVDPEGKNIKEITFKINIPKDARRMRYRTRINGFTVTIPGEYRINVKLKDGKEFKEVASIPLDVKYALKLD